MLQEFPTDLPMKEVSDVFVEALRTKSVRKKNTAKVVWNVVGYGCSLLPEDMAPVPKAAAPADCGPDDFDQLADKIQHLSAPHTSAKFSEVGKIGDGALLKSLLDAAIKLWPLIAPFILK